MTQPVLLNTANASAEYVPAGSSFKITSEVSGQVFYEDFSDQPMTSTNFYDPYEDAAVIRKSKFPSQKLAVCLVAGASLLGGGSSVVARINRLATDTLYITKPTQESNVLNSPDWRLNLKSRMQELSQLPDGWDGYDSPAPDSIAAENAKLFLDTLAQMEFEPSGIAPAADGGLVVVFFRDSKRAEIEFLNSGEVIVGMDDGINSPQVWEATEDMGENGNSLNRIQEFICG